jgi:hypothetical protein
MPVKLYKLLSILFIAILMSGCFQSETVINLKPDGSGTIQETFLLNSQFAQMMQSMSGTSGKNKQQFNVFDEQELKQQAGKLGEGVEYVKGTAVSTDEFEGYKAVYSFDDISKLTLNKNRGKAMPSGQDQQMEIVEFDFKKGKIALLTVVFPQPASDKTETQKKDSMPADQMTEQQEEMMIEQMKQMFKGMHVSVQLNIIGEILDTNASYRSGSAITLMDVHFQQLLDNPGKIRKLMQSRSSGAADIKEILQDIPGVKAESKERVKVKFK